VYRALVDGVARYGVDIGASVDQRLGSLLLGEERRELQGAEIARRKLLAALIGRDRRRRPSGFAGTAFAAEREEAPC
jgi:hypothetical protein